MRKVPDFCCNLLEKWGSAGHRKNRYLNVYLIEKRLERVTGQRYTILVIVCRLARLERTADSNMREDENEVQRSIYG